MPPWRLTGLLAVLLFTALPAVPASAAEYDDRIWITFPVAGDSSYTDDYHSCRGSNCERRHRATDIMAPYGQAVHAAKSGTITYIPGLDGNPPSWGYMITIAGNDGRDYNYVHLGRQNGPASEAYASGLKKGSKVVRGQLIGYAGCSGNASCSAPHLHFEIEDPAIIDPYGTHRRNPYKSLRAAESRGDVADAIHPRDSSTTDTSSQTAGPQPLTGDFDGNGTTDLGWYADGSVVLRTSGGEVLRFSYGRSGDLAVTGDWDADGVSTVGVVRNATWYLKNTHAGGSADVSFTAGSPDATPIAGDWDNDGSDSAGYVDDSGWALLEGNRSDAAVTRLAYGRLSSGDVPVVGDWNADGRTTVGIIRDNYWYLSNSNSGGSADAVFPYGRPSRGDLPVTGDWDGDGSETVGVVRSGTWYLKNSLAGGAADVTITFPN